MGRMKQKADEENVPAADTEATAETAPAAAPEQPSQLLLTHQAFGIYKAPNGEWTIAVISYNPITGQAGNMKSIATGGFRDMAIERFKIEAGHMLYADPK